MSYQIVKADFLSVEFSNWTGNPLFMCENVAMTLNRISHVTNILLSKIQSTWKILLSEFSDWTGNLLLT